MPTLDLGEEQSSAATGSAEDSDKKNAERKENEKTDEKDDSASGPPVSMPSLDDEGESTNQTATENPENEEHQEVVEEQMETDEKDGEPENQEEVQQEEGETTQEEGVQQDDDGEEHQTEEGEHEQEQLTQMELDGIEGVEGGNIKFIINENGQLIQLDESHILTTDADGNQILVQGTAGDSEHIQQLLQSVGAFTEGDGSGQQMVLVQEGDSEPQLIDASQLINADGHHIVIQQGDEVQLEDQEQDGETVAVSYADA